MLKTSHQPRTMSKKKITSSKKEQLWKEKKKKWLILSKNSKMVNPKSKMPTMNQRRSKLWTKLRAQKRKQKTKLIKQHKIKTFKLLTNRSKPKTSFSRKSLNFLTALDAFTCGRLMKMDTKWLWLPLKKIFTIHTRLEFSELTAQLLQKEKNLSCGGMMQILIPLFLFITRTTWSLKVWRITCIFTLT